MLVSSETATVAARQLTDKTADFVTSVRLLDAKYQGSACKATLVYHRHDTYADRSRIGEVQHQFSMPGGAYGHGRRDPAPALPLALAPDCSIAILVAFAPEYRQEPIDPGAAVEVEYTFVNTGIRSALIAAGAFEIESGGDAFEFEIPGKPEFGNLPAPKKSAAISCQGRASAISRGAGSPRATRRSVSARPRRTAART